jgi:hypothetical protein
MIIKKLLAFLTLAIINSVYNKDVGSIEILGIEPIAGPVYGDTRVTVRMKDFDVSLIDDYPHPRCRFGSHKNTVNATYVKCADHPRSVGEKETSPSERNETCVQCENSPAHTADIIPFTLSILGDFTDTKNSMPYRYYVEPKITWIYPRYGPKDGGTFVEVFGENFLNFDQNLRCAFGSKEVKAYYVNDNYMICYSPGSDVIQKELPFSISLNNQQNTKQDVPYVYYEIPTVSRLEPNRGPDTGGTVVRIRGQNFNPMIELNDMDNKNDTFCKFGNLSIAQAKVISSTEMECVSPSSYEDRQVPVEITLNNREWTDDLVLFFYYHPPFIYFINPKIGPVSGGTVVTITGSNFENTGFVECKFGDKSVKGDYVNENELRCVSPEVEKPGTVGLAVAIRKDEFSSGENTKYKYYATPVIEKIEPECGPERGFTQITLFGTNFPDKDSEYVKCVFDRTIFMNATVMSDTEIKCDSPSVLNYAGKNENGIKSYTVELTLNGIDINGPGKLFSYYEETWISSVTPILGPVDGGTFVNITGGDFNQTGVCNVTVRFATYQVKPDYFDSNVISVRSPKASYPGAVVVQVALNGRQFDKDIIINFRDEENTFYYYKLPLITDVKPEKGPTIGGTEITLNGVGFRDPFYSDTFTEEERKLYYRFVECNNENRIVHYSGTEQVEASAEHDKVLFEEDGSTYTLVKHSHHVEIFSPRVYTNDTVCVQISYNKQDYQTVKDKFFQYYILPNVTDINPKYGPLKTSDYQKIEVSLDNYYCTENCNEILCRFKSKNNIYQEKGEYTEPNKVNCTVPKVNIPESFNVEVSFNNGEDFTNNGKTYTFYDPYVIKVEPQMISSKGRTKLNIHGYGFADSGENLKVKFGSSNRPIKCDMKVCIKPATYINENLIQVETYPRNEVLDEMTNQMFGYERFPVEVSVYQDDFTNNNVTIFYFDEPEIITDLYSNNNIDLDPNSKAELANALISSLPANLDTMIPIPVDSSKIRNFFKQIDPYSKYSCRFQMKGNSNSSSTAEKVTYGIITNFPTTSENKNIFLCQSPVWEEVGPARIQISLNGHDFSESEYSIMFSDPVTIKKVHPTCGPLTGDTDVTLVGTGFKNQDNYVFKWGPQNLVPMNSSTTVTDITPEDDIDATILKQTKFSLKKILVQSPEAPDYLKTQGGLDYISVAALNFLPLNSEMEKFYANQYIHTKFEYYYYRQPYVQSISPHGSIMTGGTTVLVVGAWFQNKPQYGVKPFCKFGDKIVEGVYLSTVRILCVAPPYPTPDKIVDFDVSLNGFDFTQSGIQFKYYNDFTNAKFESIAPTSGPETGGTHIKIFGQNFTKLVTADEFLCQFKPDNSILQPKNVPAGYRYYNSTSTAIICNTPGGWTSGTKASILISFDGQNFMDTNFDFYFYKIDAIVPRAGPTTGGAPIQIFGGGFQDSSKVKCKLNKVNSKPISVKENKIECPMLPAYGNNFTGYVDFALMLNGIDPKTFTNGFYYYQQPNVDYIYPKSGPSKGEGIVKVYGQGFRDDFNGANIGCKIGKSFGKGEVVNSGEILCRFNRLPLLENNRTMNLSIALNNYSFTESNENTTFVPYGIMSISPSSGPIQGGSRVDIKGAGFNENSKGRCRFGVPGYYYYTNTEFIDYNRIVCNSPEDFKVPIAGQLPLTVPFSIAFNDDEFNPWTESTHVFSFYENPEILSILPIEGKTSRATEVSIFANPEKPFSMRKFIYKF